MYRLYIYTYHGYDYIYIYILSCIYISYSPLIFRMVSPMALLRMELLSWKIWTRDRKNAAAAMRENAMANHRKTLGKWWLNGI